MVARALGTGQIPILAPGSDNMAHLSLPDVFLACLAASVPPKHFLRAVQRRFTRDSVAVLLKVPVLHEGALRMPALHGIAWADPVPRAERAALWGYQAAAVVYPGLPDVLVRAAPRPVGGGCAPPGCLLRAPARQAPERAQVLIQRGVQLCKDGRELVSEQPALARLRCSLLRTGTASQHQHRHHPAMHQHTSCC